MGGIFADRLSTLLDSEKGAKIADRVQELLLFLKKDSLMKIKRKAEEDEPDPKRKIKEESENKNEAIKSAVSLSNVDVSNGELIVRCSTQI